MKAFCYSFILNQERRKHTFPFFMFFPFFAFMVLMKEHSSEILGEMGLFVYLMM